MPYITVKIHQIKAALVDFLIFLSYMLVFYHLMLMFISSALAKEADYLQVGSIADIDFGIWTQAGNISNQTLSCIASASDDAPNPRSSTAERKNYQIKIENIPNASNFYLYLDGDSINSENRRVLISFSHRDILTGNTYEPLTPNNFETHLHKGQFKNCVTDGNNSEIKIDISASELSGKVSGSYSGTFRLTALGGASGTQIDTVIFNVYLQIQAGAEVQISRLDDLNLGSHSGSGNINAQERFCIYSSAISGNYSLEISSINQDSSGQFYLDGVSLGRIPYDLAFIDSGTLGGGTAVGNLSLSGTGNSSSPDCAGSDNATLTLTINEVDLQSAASGIYQDTLMLLVQPQ